ncbi:MAG: DUF1697 domain-containing protein [Candidatus Limnocylindria bacterium]
MTTYVALLRGINLGGRQRIAMERLRAVFVSLGHESVTTYVQSGNVVFTSRIEDAGALAAGIEQRIAEELELEVSVVTRRAGELVEVLDGNPFLRRRADPSKLHVTFLGDAPDESAVALVDADRYAPDELVVAGREVYLHCPGGYGRTKLTNAFFEQRLGVVATTRNWRTVTKLVELSNQRS